ncbi:hypothetical protein PPTG_19230 [Phytophthora nicotianae INRA-310]|uniref:Transposase Tc1-like domain-containing protein n=1 Tax=Phytophthora nicotianae (strain INRA-310) TaxID=761204 RepID=W2PF30_PHYN3|nr:hypothetical protein PPTG_19230 [Phytophthora nicotianae INRA-310]ETM98793.1 hypothetical protein PPTG_19230 [Phytophthora nicotianae INRA-310]
MSERVAAVVTSRASQRGRKMMDRAEIRKRIYQTRVADRNNYRTVDEGAGLTPYMIRQLQREGYLRRALTQTPPVYAPTYDTVHVNEKWYYVKKIGQKVYLLTGQDGTPSRPRGNWDGKIGTWPVVEKYVTQRRSDNSDAGVEELRPTSMTREFYRRMQLEDVIPAIKAKWEWAKDEGAGRSSCKSNLGTAR